MQIDDLLSNGMVRRWSLVDGQARCVEDALASADAGATAALQRNAAIRVLIGAVEAYEAAHVLVARGEPDNGQPKQIPDPAAVRPDDAPEDWTAPLIDNPAWALLPRTVETTGQDDQPQTTPEPRWQAFDAAGAIIAAASATTLALARWRQGEPSEADTDAHAAFLSWDQLLLEAEWAQAKADALAALATEAAKPLAADPRPVPDEISDRQFWQSAALLGYITEAEAFAAVTVGTIPNILVNAIAQLPTSKQFPVKMAVAGSNTFHLSNPATGLLMQLLGRGPADAIAIWRLGASLP